MSDEERIKDARSGLYVAYLQSTPSDDHLIMAHVLSALHQLDAVLGTPYPSMTTAMLAGRAEVSP